MRIKELNLPFGVIRVLVNETAAEFEFRELSDKTYSVGDKKVRVMGAVEIIIDPTVFKSGDIIFVESSAGNLLDDGGGYEMNNAVAELAEYTYAIGGPDTAFIEWNYGNIPGDTPNAEKYGYIHRELRYEFAGLYLNGIKYQIVDGNEDCRYTEGKLLIKVVWESNQHDYAYDIVSYLTC